MLEAILIYTMIHFNNKSSTIKLNLVHTRRAFQYFILLSILFFSFNSCSSIKTFAFQCDRQDIALYVNDVLIGNGNGEYTIQKGEKNLQVSCRENGIEVYSRNFPIDYLQGNYIELSIPKDMYYGSGGPKRSRPRN